MGKARDGTAITCECFGTGDLQHPKTLLATGLLQRHHCRGPIFGRYSGHHETNRAEKSWW